MNNEIREIRFEGNTGGELYCQYVDEELIKHKYKCSCTHKKAPSNMQKLQKIIAYSGDIKRRYIFLDHRKPTQEQRELDAQLGVTRYTRSKEYQAAMDELCMFVTIGKNSHDDSADSLTQLEMFIEGSGNNIQCQIIRSPI